MNGESENKKTGNKESADRESDGFERIRSIKFDPAGKKRNREPGILRRFFRKPQARIYLCILSGLAAVCILAPLLSPWNPNLIDPMSKFAAMSAVHPLGADYLGRDILSRLLWGGRITLGCAAAVTGVSATLGIGIGMFSGYAGGRTDRGIMKGSDVLRAFPGIVLVLIVVSILGTGIGNVCLAMLLTRWIWYARVSRNLAREELSRTSIMASRLAGSGRFKILRLHILPAILPQMLAVLSIDLGSALLAISGYSFLGLGIKPPDPEWGMMVNDGRNYMEHPGAMFWPGLCILAAVISVNLLGDQLRDALEENRS